MERRGRVDQSMQVLITGAWGFVGGRLAQRLADKGHSIILGSRNPVRAHDWCSNATVATLDWECESSLKEACRGVDAIIHTAGMNAQDCMSHPAAALQINGVNTARLIEAAVQAGVRRVLYLSTAHVYASPLAGQISETAWPRNLHPYATSHLAGENVVLQSAQRQGIDGVVLRLSNAFGAPAHRDVNCWMLLVNDLCRQAVETRQMRLMTSGAQQRNFIPLGSVCQFTERLLDVNLKMQTARVLNVGAENSRSVMEMARAIQARCHVVLGYVPELKIPSEAEGSQQGELRYLIDDALDLVGPIAFDYCHEIDELLRFSQRNFGVHQATLQ